jgi:hypothetical protein
MSYECKGNSNNKSLTGNGAQQEDSCYRTIPRDAIEPPVSEALLFTSIFKECLRRRDTFVISPRTLPKLNNDKREDIRLTTTQATSLIRFLLNKRKNKTGTTVRFIIWPLFVGPEQHGHWALAVADTRTRSMLQLDSLQSLQQAASAFALSRAILAQVVGELSVISVPHSQQQPSENSCGRHVIAWVRDVLSSEPNTLNSALRQRRIGGGPVKTTCLLCGDTFATKQVAQRHGASHHGKSCADMEAHLAKATPGVNKAKADLVKTTPGVNKAKAVEALPATATSADKEDLIQLRQQSGFTADTIIDAAVAWMELRHKDARVAWFPTFVSYLLESRTGGLGSEYTRMRVTDTLLLPVHINGNHWTLLIAKKATKEITIVDSIAGSRHPKHYTRLIQGLSEVLGTDTKWHIQMAKSATQPTGSNQCGPYVIVQAVRVLMKAPILTGTGRSIHEARAIIAKAVTTKDWTSFAEYALSHENPGAGFREVRASGHPDRIPLAAIAAIKLIPVTKEMWQRRVDLQAVGLDTWAQAFRAASVAILHAQATERAPAPLSLELIRLSQQLKAKQNWDPATQKNWLYLLATVFSRLPQVTSPPVAAIDLSLSKPWRDATKALQAQHAALAALKERPVMTRTEIQKGLERLDHVDTRGMPKAEIEQFLKWSWMTDGRPSGVATLRGANPQIVGGDLMILWTEDKRAKTTGQPYTTRLLLPQRWRAEVEQKIAQTPRESRLFPFVHKNYKKVTNFIRYKLGLKFRAMRRGPPHILVQAGVDPQQVKQATGHVTDNQLMKYLNWGRTIPMSRKMASAVQRFL